MKKIGREQAQKPSSVDGLMEIMEANILINFRNGHTMFMSNKANPRRYVPNQRENYDQILWYVRKVALLM